MSARDEGVLCQWAGQPGQVKRDERRTVLGEEDLEGGVAATFGRYPVARFECGEERVAHVLRVGRRLDAVGDAKVEAVLWGARRAPRQPRYSRERRQQKVAHLEVELRDLRRDEDEGDVAQVLDVAQALDDRQLVDEDRVKVAILRVVEHARLLERVDDRDLEPELLDRLDDARVVVQGVDEEDAPPRVRDCLLYTSPSPRDS